MGRGNDDTIGESGFAAAVVGKNRVRNNRSWRVFVALRQHDFDPVRRQDLKRAGQSRHGKGVRVHAEKQRAVDPVLLPVETNSLADC